MSTGMSPSAKAYLNSTLQCLRAKARKALSRPKGKSSEPLPRAKSAKSAALDVLKSIKRVRRGVTTDEALGGFWLAFELWAANDRLDRLTYPGRQLEIAQAVSFGYTQRKQTRKGEISRERVLAVKAEARRLGLPTNATALWKLFLKRYGRPRTASWKTRQRQITDTSGIRMIRRILAKS